MTFLKLAAVALATASMSGGVERHNTKAHRPMTPAALAAATERRAEKTSFADLERFGEAAARGTGRENLNRLQHVALIMLNQAEFGKFEHFNGILLRNARRDGDGRYQTIAKINTLRSFFDRGDGSTQAEVEHIARTEPDWFARVYAMSIAALMRANEKEDGSALELMSDAQSLVPDGDPYADAANAYIWESTGIALMDLYDLQGSAAAFDRADFQDTNPLYPRPDFDGVYNVAHLAVQLGDAKLARDVAAINHRLTIRSDLPMPALNVWDMNLCGLVADAFGQPREVLDCFKPLDRQLTGAQNLATSIIPMRAIAEARIGDLKDAAEDLELLRKLKNSGRFEAASFWRMPQVESELLLASGHDKEAFAKLRDYELQSSTTNAQRFNAGIHQVTGELQTQLQVARRDAELKQDIIRAQRWVAALAALMVVGAALLVLWQRRVAARLRLAGQRAEAANRAKSEFLANMSHEIRTPLNGVVGVADMLARGKLAPKEREMVEIIRGSGQSLERLLSDVLDLARVEAGQMTIEVAPFQAADVVHSVARLSRLRADEKGLAVHCEVDRALERWFLGDATRVRQILTNLLSNAVKFTQEGSVTLQAESPSPGRLRFSVTDTGVGFDDEDKERLFGRFQQADGSITRRFGGSGLGLAICRQLATLMGGEFDCMSNPGEGSRFWFEAPFPPAAAPAEVAEEMADAGRMEERAVKVLLADDHVTNQAVIRMMLDQFGASTVMVGNGAEALEAMEGEEFDVVLMDMQMPVMDGLAATREIRAREARAGARRTPVVMLTANALPEHREASLAAGANGHVSKPITVADLLGALTRALEPEQEIREVA
jgi:signal transduction histidine kinase/AmiR/NasT family two-component response regulator